MGCCGKGKGVVSKVGSIISGYANKTASDIFFVRGELYEKAKDREAVCLGCEFNTWMKKADYLAWLKLNGIEILKNLDDLTVLPPLEKHDFEKGKSLFCRVCKCWIPAKAYAKDSKCPKDKW